MLEQVNLVQKCDMGLVKGGLFVDDQSVSGQVISQWINFLVSYQQLRRQGKVQCLQGNVHRSTRIVVFEPKIEEESILKGKTALS